MARAQRSSPSDVPFAKLSQKAKNARLAEILDRWYEPACAKQLAEALAGGADPNAKLNGETAIQQISGHGDLSKLFELLIAAGGDPRAKTKTGDTPPHLAARHGYAKSLALFLDAGVPLDFRDGAGNTLLHRAAGDGYNGSDKTVTLLLKRGADPMAKNVAGKTVIEVAAPDHKKRMLKLVTKPLSAKAKALLAAVAANDAKKVVKALAQGADPCEVDLTSGKRWGESGLDGVAALHLAFARGVGLEVIELLLAHRQLDVNVRSGRGQTPLHLVANFRRGAERAALVDKLLALGANVDAIDDRGETPIFQVISFWELDGELELVDRLLAAGASKRIVDRFGESALDQMFECTQRFSEVNDKPGFVAVMDALIARKFKTRYGKQLAAWLKAKGAKYRPTASKAKPAKPPKPSKERLLFDKLTGGTLHALVGKQTTLELAGKRRPVALFDFFVYAAEQREDKSNHLEEIAEYHLDDQALDKVGKRQWIPFGIVGMNGTIESYQEIGVDGTLYLDLSKAKGNDAPVVFATQAYMGLSPAKPLKPGTLTYRALLATLKSAR